MKEREKGRDCKWTKSQFLFNGSDPRSLKFHTTKIDIIDLKNFEMQKYGRFIKTMIFIVEKYTNRHAFSEKHLRPANSTKKLGGN